MNKIIPFLALSLFTFNLYAQDIVWGGAGDPNSEFDGGLNDWTTTGVTDEDAIWVWEADGLADAGAYSGTQAIVSPSVSNGAMVFDSDFYDNGGTQGAFGSGVAPGPATGELVSPIMDLSTTDSLTLVFNQYYRQFQSTFKIAWSMDAGANWTEIEINQDTPLNSANSPSEFKRVPLAGAQGTDQFQVKFIMEGFYYFWIIDDVVLLDTPDNDMQVNTNFYAIAPNFLTPASQVEEFGFLADIQNNGDTDQTGVNLNMTITDEDGETIFTADNPYGQVFASTIIENSSFGDFAPPAEANKTYTGTYTITADSIDYDNTDSLYANPTNNTISFQFATSDTIFSKENGATRSIFPAENNWGGDTRSWAYGNHYHVVNGEGFYANSASFIVDTEEAGSAATAGKLIELRLYEWVDTDGNGSASPDERLFVGIGLYEMSGFERWNNGNAIKTIPLKTISQVTPELKNNTDYILMQEFRDIDGTLVEFGASAAFDYGAMVLNSEQQNRPRYSSLLGIAEDIDEEEYSSAGFGRDLVPVVRLNITEAPLYSSNQDISLPESTVVISPNPAEDIIHAELNFTENVTNVRMMLLDVNGRVIARRALADYTRGTESFDASNLATGTYFLYIWTKEGQITKKVMVK